jgi:eukaryotic-like serine/threonine-protein kinase
MSVRQKIWAEWQQRGAPDMVCTLREHPDLLHQKSLVMELAMDEYDARCKDSTIEDLTGFCERFQEFGSAIYNSIHHALEVQRHFTEEVLWPDAGDEIGGFDVLEQLGRGASARVYLCLERDLGNRQVVLKVSPHTSFEASILGRLVHPNITPLYSAGYIAERELNFLCMPFAGRSTLADLVEIAFKNGCPRTEAPIAEAAIRWYEESAPQRKGPAWVPRRFRFDTYIDGVLRIAVQIADALALAHDKRILHGDLKPSNVLLTPQAQPLLLDFNLSHDFSAATRTCGGTLPYMPPEHLRILRDSSGTSYDPEFTSASDIYSFGALVYELLAGKTPIATSVLCNEPSIAAGNALEELERGIPATRQFNPLVGQRLSAIVSQCLSMSPADRPATMRQIKAVLQAEQHSLSALFRRARIRPLLFSMIVGAPTVALASGLAFVALQPPSHLRDYQRGIELVASNRPNEATRYFASAVGADPTYAPARYELARSRLAIGDIDLAMTDFDFLAKQGFDRPCLAYLAYCFNLKHGATFAIPLYERAIRNGHGTLATYNNLAASYLDGASSLSSKERLQTIQLYLDKAYALDPASTSVNLNYVRLAIKRSNLDAKFEPVTSWQYAKPLLNQIRKNEYIRLQLASWCNCISERTVPKNSHDGDEKSVVELGPMNDPRLKSLIADCDTAQLELDGLLSPANAKMQLSGTKACYIEPR